MSLLQLPISQFKTLSLSSPFIHGTSLPRPLSPPTTISLSPPSKPISIRAMKTLQGKVICATNDKTVSVEVTRLAPHPKYKRRIRMKKKFQAHDPDNVFKVGDIVQLEKSKPISRTKTFVAVPVPERGAKKKEKEVELAIPLESQQS